MKKIVVEFITVPKPGRPEKRVVKRVQSLVKNLAKVLGVNISVKDTDQFGWFHGITDKNLTLDEVTETFTKSGQVFHVETNVRYSPVQEPWTEVHTSKSYGPLILHFENDVLKHVCIPTSTDYY